MRWFALLGLLASCAAPTATVPPTEARPAALTSRRPPNIIFLLTDDQEMELAAPRYMPNLHALVRTKGAELERLYTELSECCPARATILTGLPMNKTRVYHNGNQDNGGEYPVSYYGGFSHFAWQGLEKDTIGTRLQDAGYWTVFVGSKYLNQYPLMLPEGPVGKRKRNNYYVPPGWSYWSVMSGGLDDEGFDARFISRVGGASPTYDPPGTHPKNPPSFSNFLEDLLFEKAMSGIDLGLRQSKPFFLHLSVLAPHHPAHVAPRHAPCLDREWRVPRTPNFDEAHVADKAWHQRLPRMNEKTIAIADEEFASRVCSMQAVDEGIARLVEVLDAANQLDNTYFVVHSDNGYHLGTHRFRRGKRLPYEEDILVPFLARGPGIAPGTRVSGLASNLDIAPTLLDLAGVPAAPFMEGRSFKSDLLGTGTALRSRKVILLERTETAVPDGFPGATSGECRVYERETYANHNKWVDANRDHLGLRTERFTYIRWCEGERELYDNVVDPYQLDNLIAQPALSPDEEGWVPPRRVNPAFLRELDERIAALRGCKGPLECTAQEDAPFVAPAYDEPPPQAGAAPTR